MLDAAPRSLVDIKGHVQTNPKRHSAGGESELNAIPKYPTQAARQNLTPVGVHAPDARNVPLQLAIFDQCRHGSLGGPVSLDVEQRADCCGTAQHRRRRDDVADAKAGSENLRERADPRNSWKCFGRCASSIWCCGNECHQRI